MDRIKRVKLREMLHWRPWWWGVFAMFEGCFVCNLELPVFWGEVLCSFNDQSVISLTEHLSHYDSAETRQFLCRTFQSPCPIPFWIAELRTLALVHSWGHSLRPTRCLSNEINLPYILTCRFESSGLGLFFRSVDFHKRFVQIFYSSLCCAFVGRRDLNIELRLPTPLK